MSTTPRFYTIREIATRLQVNHKTVRSLINKGILQANKIGGAIRISDLQLERFLQATTIETPPARQGVKPKPLNAPKGRWLT